MCGNSGIKNEKTFLSGFDNALHELKSYREGKLELKPLEDVLNEL